MENEVGFYEDNGEMKFKFSTKTINAVARELESMFNTPISWELIADCLRGSPKVKIKSDLVDTLLEFMEDERFDKYDGLQITMMVESLLHLDI